MSEILSAEDVAATVKLVEHDLVRGLAVSHEQLRVKSDALQQRVEALEGEKVSREFRIVELESENAMMRGNESEIARLSKTVEALEAMFSDDNPEAVTALLLNIKRNLSPERVENLCRGLSDRYCRMGALEGQLTAATEAATAKERERAAQIADERADHERRHGDYDCNCTSVAVKIAAAIRGGEGGA